MLRLKQRLQPSTTKIKVGMVIVVLQMSCETARQFAISDHHLVTSWERIYLTEGPEGLYIERRGRGSKGRPTKFPKEVEEDLLKEVQRLRAENAYLKKLQALVLERERHQKKK